MSGPLTTLGDSNIRTEHSQRTIHSQRLYELLPILDDESYRFRIARDQRSCLRDMRDERDEVGIELTEKVVLVAPCVLLANVEEAT